MDTVYSPFNNSLASPLYCQSLYRLGLKPTQMYIAWVGRNGQVAPESLWFDTDGYYKDALQVINLVNPPEYAYPAFSMADIALLLPAFTLSVEGGVYNCRITAAPPNFKAINHLRMADALAMMLLQCIEEGLSNLQKLNAHLSKN